MMLRKNILPAAVLAALFFQSAFLAAKETPLISPQMVEPYGLARAWFNQVDIDPNQSKVLHVLVEGGQMFVITNDAKLHVINAETGQSLWGRTLGHREMFFQEPAVNSRMVFAMNGMELFIFDRRNGKLLQHIPLPGAASTSCEASENYVYIPMLDQRIIAYPLVEVDGPVLEQEGGEGAEALLSDTSTEQQAQVEGIEESEDASASASRAAYDDPVLANIVRRFSEAKESIMAEAAPPEKEEDIILQKAIGIPLTTLSFDPLMVKPTLASQYVVYNKRNRVNAHFENLTWVTDRGYLVAAAISSLSTEQIDLLYRIDSSSQTYFLGSDRIARRDWGADKELGVCPTVNQSIPAFYTENRPEGSIIPSMVVVGGKAAYVFAVKDRIGEVVWQFAASGPVVERIAVIGTEVFCCTSTGGMHALNLLDGKEKWYTPDIKQFVAASKNRIYTLNRKDRLVILDRRSGAVLNSFDARRFDRFLFNIQNDRIYVINDSGLIQCLQERQPQSLENIMAGRENPPTWHRLTCKEFAGIMIGKPAPVLYWQGEVGEEATAPVESKSMPAEEEPQIESPFDEEETKVEEDVEFDPFS